MGYVPYGEGQTVVRMWTEPLAPTGEGQRYQTEDGTIWRGNLRSDVHAVSGGRSAVFEGGKFGGKLRER